MKTKKCKKCNSEKELCEFRTRKDNKSGYGNNCKICESETNKKYRENNKEQIKLKNDEFLENNKDYFKIRYENNKDKILEQSKEYYLKNKDKILDYDKIYRKENKDKIKERQKNWYTENKEKIIIKANINYIKRKNTDPLFKLKIAIKNNIYHSLKRKGFKKNSRTHEILGCLIDEFKQHLESKFEPWMTWDNYGKYDGTEGYGWDIDHIIPTSSATTEEELVKLNHFSNLQPLCSYFNRVIKRDN
jgi:hypothetical protein